LQKIDFNGNIPNFQSSSSSLPLTTSTEKDIIDNKDADPAIPAATNHKRKYDDDTTAEDS
jgi:hypothetical protein